MKRKIPFAIILIPLLGTLGGCDDKQEDQLPRETGQDSVAAESRRAEVAAPMNITPVTSLHVGAADYRQPVKNPFSGDAEAIAAGGRHFAAFNCAGCHAPLGGGGMGPPLSDASWIYGGEPAQIYLSIMHGRPNGMPDWGDMLPERVAWELVAYIETLDEIENYAQKEGFNENKRGYSQKPE